MLNVFLYLNKEEKWKQTTGQDEDENMKIIETYGNYIEKWSNENPDRARWLLKTGWKAQNLKFRFAPETDVGRAVSGKAYDGYDDKTAGTSGRKFNCQYLYSL